MAPVSPCARVLSEMVLQIEFHPVVQPAVVLPPFPAPPNPNFDDEAPEWTEWLGVQFMFCWQCDVWVPQAQGVAPVDMSCPDCAAVTATLAAWDAADAAAEAELELEEGDSE